MVDHLICPEVFLWLLEELLEERIVLFFEVALDDFKEHSTF